MTKFAALRVWAAVILLTMAASAAADSVKLVTGPDYPPFTDPNLPNGGMITEIVEAAFLEAGVEVTSPEFGPWKRGYSLVQDGVFDATFPYIQTDTRLAEMEFSASIYEARIVAVFPAGANRDYTGPESLRGLTLCQPLCYAVERPLQGMVDGGAIRTIQNSDLTGCLRQLKTGRVDAFVGGELPIKLVLKREFGGSDGFTFGSVPVERNSQHLIVAKANPKAKKIIAQFNEGLAKLRSGGEWQAIVDRHLQGNG